MVTVMTSMAAYCDLPKRDEDGSPLPQGTCYLVHLSYSEWRAS